MTGKPPRDAFADLLTSARRASGLTQEELAELSGVSRPTLARWESSRRGGKAPDPESVRAVCAVLGIDPRRAAVALGFMDDIESNPLCDDLRRARHAVGALIASHRERKGWAVHDLARRANLPEQVVAAVENGSAGNPDPEQIRPIFRALDIPLMQSAAVGYPAQAAAEREQAYTVEDIIKILEDPEVPEQAKLAVFDYLRHLRRINELRPRRTASERFYATLGRPHPGRLSPAEMAEFEHELDSIDAAIVGKRRTIGGRTVA